MIVQILEDVFVEDKNNDRLDRLWHVIEGPHILYLKDDSEIDALMNSSWYLGLRESIKEVICSLIIKSIQSPKGTNPKIKVSDIDPDLFSIEETIRYLNQPFTLVFENSKRDSFFFNALINKFKKKGKTISKYKNNGWLVFGMGGGSTIPDMLQSKMEEFIGDIFKKEPMSYLRCFVLIDSDKRFPNDTLNERLVDFLERYKIPYHILEKREMENYIPNEAFSEIKDNREFIDAFLNLSPIQMDYFDLEKGFEDKRFEQFNEEIRSLYESIQDRDFTIFRKQTLNSINSGNNNFKTEFPKIFLSDKVTQENLLARCAHHSNDPNIHPYNPNELPDLLVQISSLL